MNDQPLKTKERLAMEQLGQDLTPLLQQSIDLAALNQKMSALVAKGEAIKVCDQTTDLDAKQFELEVKSYEKAVDLYADADIQDATERLNRLRIAKMKLIQPLVLVRDKVRGIRKAWEERERRAAEEEQAKLQAKEMKKPRDERQQVTVMPAIPTVAGVPSRRNWKFKVVNPNKVPRFYWRIDEQAIGEEVRKIKDKAKAESQIPGIEVWSE